MTRFNYTARSANGEPITGSVTAASASAAGQQLRSEGKFPVRLEAASGPASPSPRPANAPLHPTASSPADDMPEGLKATSRPIRRQDILFLTNQLAVMTETGVPLNDALGSVLAQTANLRLRAVLGDIADNVCQGMPFSAALRRHPKVFGPMYCAMVEAAEASGTLGMMLDRVAGYLTDEYETIKKVTGALIYPCAMLTFAIGATVALMVGVLPRFTAIYAGKEAALPLPTRVVMAISDFLVGNWIALLVGLVGAIVGITAGLRTEGGKQWWAGAKLKLPLVGKMIHKLYLTRSLRTLGTLIGTGVSVLEAVELTGQLVRRGPFAKLWAGVQKNLHDGQQLSEPLFRDKLVPRAVSQMIAAGERSGQIPKVMDRVAEFCDRELKNQIKSTTAMIEPVMIIVMGVVIGGITMALLLPIFTISKVMSGPG